MKETAKELIARMRGDVDAYGLSTEDDDQIDLEARHRAAIEEVGAEAFLAELFLTFGAATLGSWLLFLSFVWRDLPFTSWKEILYRISWSDSADYEFVWFAWFTLGIDIRRVIIEDPRVDKVARNLVTRRLPGPYSTPGIPATIDNLAENKIDAVRMWRRLASEGAPMAVFPELLREG